MKLVELIGKTYGRVLGYTFTQVFKLTQIYPSDVDKVDTIIEDPLITFTSSPKNQKIGVESVILNYLNVQYFKVASNNYLVQNRINQLSTSPYWYYSQLNKTWFINLYSFYYDYKWLHYIPGVERVGIGGSTVIQSTSLNGDIDIILITKKYWPWFTRTIVKLILKLQGNDVNLVYLQFVLDLIKTLNLGNYSSYMSNIEIKIQSIIWRNKGLKTNVDLGFVSDNIINLSKYYPSKYHNITFVLAGFISTVKSDNYDEYKHQNISIIPRLNKLFLELLLFPFALITQLFVLYYKFKQKLGYKMVVSLSTISFYPQIFTKTLK